MVTAMTLTTPLTELLDIRHPVLLAPMEKVSGGALAAAVSNAGGLCLIGGGYGDAEWLEAEFARAGAARVGVGFITWSLARQPALLDLALEHRPAAVMLSFGDPNPFASAIKDAGAKLILQVQSLAQARAAAQAGADALTISNTIPAMAIDVTSRTPVLGAITGGLSGPGLLPVSLALVYQAVQVVDLPIIGVGGIFSAEDALQYFLAGATAVQIGSANLADLWAPVNILRQLEGFLREEGAGNLKEIIGAAQVKAPV